MTLRSTWLALLALSTSIATTRAQDPGTPKASTARSMAASTAPQSLIAPNGPVVVSNGQVVGMNGQDVAPIEMNGNSPTLLTVEAGVTFLRRSRPNRNGLIGELLNLDTDEVLQSVGTKSLDFDFEAGPNLMLRIHNGCGGSYDFRWLGLDSWSDRTVLETEDADPIGTRTPVSPFAFVLEEGAEFGGIRARARSVFHSLQAGRTGVMSESEEYTLTNYFGFRYFYFRDSIDIERAGTVDNEAYGWAANNSLVGGEIGLDIGKHYGFLTLGAKGRIGGYANFANLKGNYDLTVGSQPGIAPVSFQTESDEFTGFSGVFDLGIYSTIHHNRNFALKFGYDLIILTNLVAGTENMQPTLITITPVPGTFPTVTRGGLEAHGNSTVVLHGLSVTGELSW